MEQLPLSQCFFLELERPKEFRGDDIARYKYNSVRESLTLQGEET